MRTRSFHCIGLVIILLVLTGCWNRRELNEISIATAIGIDKNGDQFIVSVQLLNPDEIAAKKGGGQSLPVITQQIASGGTIFESIRQLSTITPRKIYSSHLRILVIGEELARSGIAEVLDVLSRDPELRTDFYIIVARDAKASEVLEILTPLEKIPSNKLFSSLKDSEQNWGVTAKMDLHQLIYDLVDKGREPAMASIRIVGNKNKGQSKENLNAVKPPTNLQYEGAAVFHGDKLVGWLSSNESKGFNYTQGNIKSTVVRVTCPDGGNLGVEVIRTHHKIKGKIENGRPVIDAEVGIEGNIGEVACRFDMTNNSILELEKQVSKEVKDDVEHAIKKAKSYKADIFGFGGAIHRANYKVWHQFEDRWDEEFVDLEIRVKVDTKIRRTGSVLESFLKKLEE
ncbi:Ger(x)C family spore germination protein [Paenibacillus sp. FSL H8-0034]|uniref:Ger(x)C family spore germination protein n=1 Tax=Paenibacillus sp. FSL H8-0034 TaxID=2954671 RepID=UPI0030F58A27